MAEMTEAVAEGEVDADFSRVDKPRLVAALKAVLPSGAVLHDDEDLRPYECDGLAAYRQLPLIVVLPTTEAEVVEVLRICSAHGAPVVPRGAGTGLSGGALPHPRGVVLSLARFNRILSVDPLARTAVVQPRVRNAATSEAVGAARALLCAGPFLADRMHHRRQCGRELGRRALPEVRAHGA